MADTLFTYLKGAVSNADDTDPETSSAFYNPPMASVQNLIHYRRETLALDLGETRTITFPDSVSGWTGILARVIGDVKLTTVGKDWDGSTSVTGVTAGYGVKQYPGMLSAVTTNVTSFTLEGLADSTTVQYVTMILASDDQL